MSSQGQLNFTSISDVLVMNTDPSRNRSRGNPNSKKAHDKVVHSKEDTYKRIIEFISSVGNATSKEIAAGLKKPLHTLSGRLSELKALNRLRGTGKSRQGAEILVLK